MRLVAARVDLPSRRVWRGDEQLVLTSTEAALLAYLAANPGRDVPRQELLERVWGYAPNAVSRTVDTAVRTLRSKVELDPSQPHHILAVYGVGYRFEPLDAAALAPSIADPPCSVPADRDAFFGRGREMQLLAEALQRSRLVTVFGMGGVGKTRLACHFVRRERHRWPGGAWFCDLLPAHDAMGIARAVAGALAVPMAGRPIEQIGHAIAAHGPCLLVLDNFEQVSAHVEQTLGVWLDRAEHASFLVTSRQVLGMAGEQLVELQGLPAPEAEQLQSDGVALLCDRIRAARPGWSPGPVAPLVEIVRRLEGLPLSIELAAARVRLMSPEALAERLRDGLVAAIAPGEGRGPRHATLTAVLDWSWGLLHPWEQQALCQLSVFEGGFDLEAAEAVLAAGPGSVDLLQALVDRALVQRADSGRLSLLACVQEYASARLAAGERERAQARHGAWYARYGTDEAFDTFRRRAGPEAVAQRTSELDNLLVAFQRAQARGDDDVAAGCAMAAWAAMSSQGPFELAAEMLEGAARCATHRRARLWLEAGGARRARGQMAVARESIERALALARAAGDTRLEGDALSALGFLDFREGRFDLAEAKYAVAYGVARASRDRWTEARVLRGTGLLHKWSQRFEQAQADFEAALELFRAEDDRRGEGISLIDLADLAQDLDQLDASLRLYEEALPILRAQNDRLSIARVHGNIGRLYCESGAHEQARTHLEVALREHQQTGYPPGEANVRLHLARSELIQGRFDAAAEHAERAREICCASADREWAAAAGVTLGLARAAVGQYDAAREQFEWALALHRELGNRRMVASGLSDLGGVAWAQGRLDQAEALLVAALEEARAGADRVEASDALLLLGLFELERGRDAQAEARCRAALEIGRDIGHDLAHGLALCTLGALAARGGQPGEALLVEGEALVHRMRMKLCRGLLLTLRAEVALRTGREDPLPLLLDAEAAPDGDSAGANAARWSRIARLRREISSG